MRGTLILVSRLLEYVNPLETIFGLELPTREEFAQADLVRMHAEPGNRDELYDVGRISYFMAWFQNSVPVDPISIDCYTNRGHVYANPVILDGWHRLAAAHLTNTARIRATFGGRLDLLRYLQGQRKTRPEE